VTNHKDQAELYYNMAKDANFYGDNVLQYLDSAISIDANDFKYFMGRGIAKMTKDLSSAIPDFDSAIKLNPNHAEAYFMRGRVKFLNNQNDGAFVDFTKAIEINSQEYRYFENRGEVRFLLKDYEGAIRDYSVAIQIIEIDSKAFYKGTYTYIYRGRAKAVLKDFKGAVDDFDKSITISETSTAYCERSNLKIENGDFRGGYEDFVKGLSWDENENVTIQFYERGFSKLSAAELIKAVLHCYTEVGQWDVESAKQLAIEIVFARSANEYHKLANNKIESGDILGGHHLLIHALQLMPEKYIWHNEIKADIERIK
jgi:tetratricopeptide (TPR) repeat protein